jgi:alanyl-tRNA synthetase
MTTRLYYADSYCTEFTAAAVDVRSHEGQTALVLDATHFYPTSGGQPYDTGELAGAQVLDVLVQDDAVLHVLAADPQVKMGATVTGRIDWPRRYDHMQQHSGQHLLSQVFYRLHGHETVAVHFGAVESTLDLDAATLEPAQIAAAEQEANRLAYAALPITAYTVTQAQLPSVPLRRPPKVSGDVRIVEIAGYDYSACGGTHVHTTAEIAPVKIVRQERRRGQTRLTFLCGLRACADYAAKHRLLTEAANLFSNEITAVPGLIGRSLEQNRDLQRRLDDLTGQLISYEARDLLATATTVNLPAGGNSVRVVRKLYADRSLDALKQAAALLRQEPGTLALLGTQAGGKLALLFARSDDVTLHAGNLLRDALKTVGGSGGGRPEIAQGGAADPTLGEAALDHALNLAQGA